MLEENNSGAKPNTADTAKAAQDYRFDRLQTRMHESFAEKAFDLWAKSKRLAYQHEATKVTRRGAIVLYRELIWSNYWTDSTATGRLKRRAISKHRYMALEASGR